MSDSRARLEPTAQHWWSRPSLDVNLQLESPFTRWLDRRRTVTWLVTGWITATLAFVAVTALLGGPIEGDAAESVYSTWAIAHGAFACAYPPATSFALPSIANPFALVAPLYPLFSGALAALFGIGHTVPFPSQAALGPHCATAFSSIYHWSVTSGAIESTVLLSYLSWVALAAGVIGLLRATGRGSRGWEPMTLLGLAVTPAVFMCLVSYFHPQDLLAIGLILGSLAGALRERWVLAGALMGLAMTSQQFAALAAIPLFVLMPSAQRTRFSVACATAIVAIDLPLIIVTSGRALNFALFGSSRLTLFGSHQVHSKGGTVLYELHWHGLALFFISRFLPLVASLVLALWAGRRLRTESFQPIAVLSIVATSLAFRLALDENLFGYYFMAVTVSLILLDVLRGHLRRSVVAWIALVSVAFNPLWLFTLNWAPWAVTFFRDLPVMFVGAGIAVVVVGIVRQRSIWLPLAWVIVVALTGFPRLWGQPAGHPFVPNWQWQIILVPWAIFLASHPLRTMVHAARTQDSLPATGT